jgi:hypothetical protein
MLNRGLVKGTNEKFTYRFKIPLSEPVQYAAFEHFISPYIMGVLIGDGSLANGTPAVSVSVRDSDIADRITMQMPDNCVIRGRMTSASVWQFNLCDNERVHANRIKNELARLGVNVKSGVKFIPNEYMIDSVDNRRALLSGLMDADGSVSSNGKRVSYSTTSYDLAHDVAELVHSLGGSAAVHEVDRANEGKGVEYHVHIIMDCNPFLTAFKRDRWSKSNARRTRSVVSIERVGVEDCMCISVDAEDHLYLTNDYIVTHNTSLAATFPAPIFIRAEDGFDVFSGKKAPNAFPVLKQGEDIFEQLDALIEQEHPFKTLIIDSITSLDKKFESDVVRKDPRAKSINQANGGYGAGYSAVAELHSKVKDRCDTLREQKGMTIVFLGHVETETMDLPDEPNYSRYSMRIHKKSIGYYTDFVSLVGLLKLETIVDQDSGKAKSFGDRVLIVDKRASSITKNRYGIVDDIAVEEGSNPLLNLIPYFKTTQE